MLAGAPAGQPYVDERTDWELTQINPWLSACDLAGPEPQDLQGSCGPIKAPAACPRPCPRSPPEPATAHPKPQCLSYLEVDAPRELCREDDGLAREARLRNLAGLRLRHCCEHAVASALAPGDLGPLEAVLAGGDKCQRVLDKLIKVDYLAARLQCEFDEVLARYDCTQAYSVIHNCTHCKEAYRKWLCSSLVPYFAHKGTKNFEPLENFWIGRRIRPCRSFCQSVEQRCPYFLPGDRAPALPTQYAGEPTFLCGDPNIPETGKQEVKALHPISEKECCFKVCSQDEPSLGLCANCTGHLPNMGAVIADPPTAPVCEITSSVSHTSTDYRHHQHGNNRHHHHKDHHASEDEKEEEKEAEEAEEGSGTDGDGKGTESEHFSYKPPALCGSGGIGSVAPEPSTSSSSPSSISSSSQLPLLCLFAFWGVFFSVGYVNYFIELFIYLSSASRRYRARLHHCPLSLLKKFVIFEAVATKKPTGLAMRLTSVVIIEPPLYGAGGIKEPLLIITAYNYNRRGRRQGTSRYWCRWLWPCRWKPWHNKKAPPRSTRPLIRPRRRPRRGPRRKRRKPCKGRHIEPPFKS